MNACRAYSFHVAFDNVNAAPKEGGGIETVEGLHIVNRYNKNSLVRDE